MYKKGAAKVRRTGRAGKFKYLAPAVQVTYLHEMRSRGEPAVQVIKNRYCDRVCTRQSFAAKHPNDALLARPFLQLRNLAG